MNGNPNEHRKAANPFYFFFETANPHFKLLKIITGNVEKHKAFKQKCAVFL